MKIIDYCLVGDFEDGGLSGKVAKALRDGWELYGDPLVAPGENQYGSSNSFHQAMIKRLKAEVVIQKKRNEEED